MKSKLLQYFNSKYTNDLNIINNSDLLNYSPNINLANIQSNIIISLTTNFETYNSDHFKNVINSLNSQLLQPKFIIIFIYGSPDQLNHLNQLNQLNQLDYPNVIIKCIVSSQYSKINWIYNITIDNVQPTDKIIFVDDTFIASQFMTYYYELCYQLYNCDAIFIDQTQTNIFSDQYKGNVFSQLSFGFKFNKIKNIKEFYNEYIKHDTDAWLFDDLFFTKTDSEKKSTVVRKIAELHGKITKIKLQK